MPGNFDCIGFAVDSSEALATLVEKMLPAAEPIGTRGDAETFRWQDESGARLVFDVKRNTVNNVLPSFAADDSTLLAAVQSVNDDTSFADIVDEQGETITRLAVDLEQRALIRGNTVRGSASLVGLVGQVNLFADEVEFRASPASLLGPADQDFGPPPPDFEREGSWPPRMGAESFFSHGMFGNARDARPIAQVNGVIVDADERPNSVTGLRFVRARVRSAGFEADVCAPVGEMPLPERGQVLAGTVYVVGSLGDWSREAPGLPDGCGSLLGRLLGRRN